MQEPHKNGSDNRNRVPGTSSDYFDCPGNRDRIRRRETERYGSDPDTPTTQHGCGKEDIGTIMGAADWTSPSSNSNASNLSPAGNHPNILYCASPYVRERLAIDYTRNPEPTRGDRLMDTPETPGSRLPSAKQMQLWRVNPDGSIERKVATVHSDAVQLTLAAQRKRRTELCSSWKRTGTCKFGSTCNFAHGTAELRPVLRHPKYKTQLCRNWSRFGRCSYGNRCCFVHATKQELMMLQTVGPIPGERALSPPAPAEGTQPEAMSPQKWQ